MQSRPTVWSLFVITNLNVLHIRRHTQGRTIFSPSHRTVIYTTHTENKALYRHLRQVSVTPLHNDNEWHRTKVQPSLRLSPSPSHYRGRCCTNEYKPPSCIRWTGMGWNENQCLLSEGVGSDILSLKCFEIYCLAEPARIWSVDSIHYYPLPASLHYTL